MAVYYREVKFYVTILYLDILIKTTKLLNKKLLDQKKFTLRFKMAAMLDCLASY